MCLFLATEQKPCIFHDKPRHRYRDVAKTTCGIRQSNYLPLLLYRIPLTHRAAQRVPMWWMGNALSMEYRIPLTHRAAQHVPMWWMGNALSMEGCQVIIIQKAWS